MATRRRRKKRGEAGIYPILVAAGVIFILIVALVASFLWSRYSMGTEYANLESVFSVEGDEAAVYVDLERLSVSGVVKEGAFYLDLDTVREYLDSRYYYGSNGEIRYVLPDEIVIVEEGVSSFDMQGISVELGHAAFFVEEDTVYLAMDFVACFTVLTYETYDEPYRLFITTEFEVEKTVATVKTASQVRYQAGIKSGILTDVARGETVQILGELDDWTRVYYNGCIGYIQTKKLSEAYTATEEAPFEAWEYVGVTKEGTICMVWHQVFSAADNANLTSLLDGTEGVNVISPTWLSLSDNEGNFVSYAMASYVTTAHELGMDVWILVDDFDASISLYTILSSDETRTLLIQRLVNAVLEVGADGINIDFENVSSDCGVHFVEFIRELALACHQNGLVLSVDNFVPAGGRAWVDRAEQGVMADYVVVMSYDEHYSGSTEAGSVASYTFSRSGILDTIAAGVPAEKIINGIPFYTRVWTETPESLASSGAAIYSSAGAIYSRYALSSYATDMATAAALLSQNGASLYWLSEEQQYYGEYEVNGSTVRIWLETVESIEAKLSLITENSIAGAAFWKLGMEDSSVWSVIRSCLS